MRQVKYSHVIYKEKEQEAWVRAQRYRTSDWRREK